MSSSRNLTMQDLLNVLNNANNNDKQNNNLQTHASSTETHDLSFYNLSSEIISLPIPKQSGKYNLQKALGLKNQKQRWLGYLETMRDCILEKGVTFDVSYREQKAQITNGIVRAVGYFKKKRDNKNAKVVDGNRNSNEENNENHDSEIGETNNSEDRGEHDSISEPVQDSTRRSEKAKQTTAVQKKVVKQKRTNKRS
ncbi:hypothetical protein RhiirA1_474346 [Rhizophagus irregularis]|uniref:Uncharacterized protein n=1 Tax=Rhizophagus irregularis TaxID=588596 RepID=A0A2N0QYR5_9GLOM|nr:hypothetical protein RhiirA1_474346 [Rhizophagus irregularis]